MAPNNRPITGRAGRPWLRLLLAALLILPLACHLGQEGQTETFLDLSKLYDSLGGYDSIHVRMLDLDGNLRETIFHGELKSRQDLEAMAVQGYQGEPVILSIHGFKDGKVVYQVDRYYDGNRHRIDSASIHRVPGMQVKLAEPLLQLKEGDSAELPAVTVLPGELADRSHAWTVLDADYLVLGPAHFRGLKAGTGRLRVSLKADTSCHAILTVQINPKGGDIGRAPDSLRVRPDYLVVAVNGAAKSFTHQVYPDTANAAVTWGSTDPVTASISPEGEVRGLRKGRAKIWAASAQDGRITDTAEVEVLDEVQVDSVRFPTESLDLLLGAAPVDLSARVYPAEADSRMDLEVSDTLVARLVDGRLEGRKEGPVSVTARSRKDASKSDTLRVTVRKLQPVNGVAIEPRDIRLYTGGAVKELKATVEPAGTLQAVLWKSSDTLVAAVDAAGKASPKGVGRAWIIATSVLDPSKPDSVQVIVKQDMPRLSVGRDTTVSVGSLVTFQPKVGQDHGTVVAFKWDLDGDSIYEGSAVSPDSLKAPLTHLYGKEKNYETRFYVKDSEGNDTTVIRNVQAISGPVVLIRSPLNGSYTNQASIDVVWTVNGAEQAAGTKETLAKEGANQITRTYRDSALKDHSVTITVNLDRAPPGKPEVHGVAKTRSRTPAWSWKSGGGGIGSYRYRLDTLDLENLAGVKDTAFAAPAPLAEGKHTLHVQERDEAGNWSPKGSLETVVDLTPPPEPTVRSASAVTNNRTPAWTWRSGGTDGAGSFQYKLGDSAFSVGATSTADTAFTPSGNLAAGVHTLYVREFDAAGNPSAPGRFSITIDLTPPGKPNVAALPSLTRNPRPRWSWSSGGDGSGTFRHKLDDSVLTVGATETVALTYTPVADLGEGAHTLYVQERDAVGNWSPIGRFTITVDLTPPGVPTVSVASGGLKPTWSWTTGGDGYGGWRHKLDDTVMATAKETSVPSYTPETSLSEGEHTLYVQERDAAGNWSKMGSKAITVEKLPNTLSDEEKAQGFTLLFDGTRAGFNGNFVNYVKGSATNTNLGTQWAVDTAGSLITTTGTADNIRSVNTYRNFDLRLDYRNDGNQGIFYRHLMTLDLQGQTGVEYAINNATTTDKLSPGAAVDMYAPTPNAYKAFATGQWNSARIVAVGDSVEHWMNGVKIAGFRFHSAGWWTAYSASKWNAANTMSYVLPGDKTAGYIAEGHIGFEGDHGGKWQIKNLRINTATPTLGPP